MLISADDGGKAAGLAGHDSDVRDFTMTADGNFISFVSDTLQPDQSGEPTSRLFLRDVAARKPRLSASWPIAPPAKSSRRSISISSNGRYVAFESSLDGYLTGVSDQPSADQVYVRDVIDQETLPVSVSPDGKSAGDGTSSSPVLSSDGHYLVFESGSSNLGATQEAVPIPPSVPPRSGERDDRACKRGQRRQNRRWPSDEAVTSADGRFIAFETSSTNFVGANYRQATIVVRRDMQNQSTGLVSGVIPVGDGTVSSFDPHITPDGRFVGYESTAQMTADPIAFGTVNIYVRDLVGGGTTLASMMSGTGFGIIRTRVPPTSTCRGRSKVLSLAPMASLLGLTPAISAIPRRRSERQQPRYRPRAGRAELSRRDLNKNPLNRPGQLRHRWDAGNVYQFGS